MSAGTFSDTHQDPKAYRIDARFFQRIYELSYPYWRYRKGVWKPWLIFAILLFSSVGFSLVGGYFSYITAETTNALVDRSQIYWRLMIWMSFIGVLQSTASIFLDFISSKLILDWRAWLTQHLVEAYLSERTYYEIHKDESIDNPDQRIQEEVSRFCSTMIGIPQFLLASLFVISVQGSILTNVSNTMFWTVIIYAVINTLVTLWIYRPTIKQNWDLTVASAQFRSGLMHLCDNAETIAFYRGERNERKRLITHLKAVAKVKLTIIFYGLRLSAVNQLMSIIFTLLPIFFIVPLYFNGDIEFGTIDQTTVAAAMILSSLSVISNFIPVLSQTVPTVVRLSQIREKSCALANGESTTEGKRIQRVESDTVSLQHIDMYTPNGELCLVKNLSLDIAPGTHTVIVGRTGVGKSSLLRVMAGLWTRGQGEVRIPTGKNLLFIPQRPYMLLTDLRSQLLYPRPDEVVDDATMYAVFKRLGQPEFIDKHEGLDSIKDWRKVLSLGEQQLVAFARILLSPPRYVFLDEATSAMDIETEKHVYRCLLKLDTTFVSVGHRETILPFHTQRLQLMTEGKWQVSQHPAPPTEQSMAPVMQAG